jgi:hypothetical protein
MLEFVGEIEMYCKFPEWIVSDQSSNCRNEVAQGLVCWLPSELSPPRSRDSITAGGHPARRRAARLNEGLAARIAALIQRHPTCGYRRLWALRGVSRLKH